MDEHTTRPAYPDQVAKLLDELFPAGLPDNTRLLVRLVTVLDVAVAMARTGRAVGVPMWVRFGDADTVESQEVPRG